ncbi:MAG: hypothetical protein K2X57_30690 [Xanthobacteraceae bacterium]|nr:hypothetical protein [Xanthobacteraceae bacterium]
MIVAVVDLCGVLQNFPHFTQSLQRWRDRRQHSKINPATSKTLKTVDWKPLTISVYRKLPRYLLDHEVGCFALDEVIDRLYALGYRLI